MKKVTIKDLTSNGLRALAKDIKFPKYSRMSTDDLRKGLAKEDLSKVDLSKYDIYDIEEEVVAEPKKEEAEVKVPVAPRRSVSVRRFGRR
jgi:hypothetical protein